MTPEEALELIRRSNPTGLKAKPFMPPAPVVKHAFDPSPQQQAIFDEIAKGLEFCEMPFFNILVDAKAGSGKTTTIVESMRYIPREGLVPPRTVFLAFNKSIADTLRSKCPPGVVCSTFHSLGRRALVGSGLVLPSVKLDTNKARKLVWNAISDREDPDTRNICRLVSMAKTVAIDVGEIDFEAVCYHHDITLERPERGFNIVRSVVEATLYDTTTIDFDDMLYMPVMHNISFDHYNYVFVDEAQDTNDIQLEILSRLCATRSRLVAVGDPHQAIYGFRGANADSMSRIAQRFSCKTYPLSVSYRCPKAVVKEAQRYLQPLE